MTIIFLNVRIFELTMALFPVMKISAVYVNGIERVVESSNTVRCWIGPDIAPVCCYRC